MLNAMRKHASSWAVRMLLGLLIVSFAVWGIGDVFLGSGDNATVAEVGELAVGVNDVNRAFEQRYQQFNRAVGGALDRQSAIAFGVLDQAVQSQIAEKLVDMHGRDLGLGVSDDALREAIQSDPSFRGAGGFDRQTMEFHLRSQGLTETDFIELVRNEIRRRAILTAITDTVPVSDIGVERIYEFRNEQRIGTALIVEAAAMTVAEPDEATLAAYLADNQANYEAPEFRAGVVIRLEPEDLIDEIAMEEERLREVYQARMTEFSTPEERELGQLLAPDQATADEVMAALAESQDFATIAETFADRGVSYSSIGPVTAADLPGGLAEAAFTLAADAVSAPVQSDFGFHIFTPIRIVEGSQVPFEDVREDIGRELALREARDQLPDLAARLDDEIAAGETLEAAAETLQLTLTDVPLTSRDGIRKDDGAGGTTPSEILSAMYQGDLSENSLLEESSSGGYFIYRVDEIEPAQPLAVDEARADLIADWSATRRQEAAAELAETLAGQAREGRQLDAIAAEQGAGVRLVTSQPLLRSANGAEDGLSRSAVAAMFATEPGKIAQSVVEVAEGYAIMRTDEVIAAPSEGDLAALRAEIAQARQTETLAEYEAHLRQRYPVSLNQRALEVFYQDASGS